MKSKKTFFERLTGSIHVEDEQPETEEVVHKEGKWLSQVEEEEQGEGELPVDVFETPHDIVVRTMIAGVKPEDLEITITREMVTIRGKRHTVHEHEGADFFHKELYWGSFSRTILLPREVEADEAEATEKHGLLTIKLPKINKEKVSSLRVRSLN